MTLLERMARAYAEADGEPWPSAVDGYESAVMGMVQALRDGVEFERTDADRAALAVLREEQAPAFDGGKSMERRKRDQAPPPPCATCGGTRNVLVRGKINSCPDCARGAR